MPGPIRLAIAALVTSASLFPVTAHADFGFISQWGSHGSGNGQFEGGISAINVDAAGNVYVADAGNFRVQKFTNDGQFIAAFGSKGTADGQLQSIDGMGIDPGSGNVFLGDHQATPRAERWTSGGAFVSVFKEFPQNIHDLTVDLQGNVIVVTGGGGPGDFIEKFDQSGNKTANWGDFGSPAETDKFAPSSQTHPAADSQGNVYVTDSSYTRIHKFSPTGQSLLTFGSKGSGDGQFAIGTGGIAVDPQDNLWATDPSGSRVEKFAPDGTFLSKFGTNGTNPGQMVLPTGVAVDKTGNVFVVDDNQSHIQKWGDKTVTPTTPSTPVEKPQPKSVTQPPGSCTAAPPNVCVQGPADLQKFGCLRIGNFKHRFGVALKKTRAGLIVNRVSRVKIVLFSLDGGSAGSDNKRPYQIFVSGAVLKPGSHVMRANVRMQVPKYLVKRFPNRFKKTKFTRNLKFPFKTC